MDGSVLNLDLVSGSNTTVKQLEKQILKVRVDTVRASTFSRTKLLTNRAFFLAYRLGKNTLKIRVVKKSMRVLYN